MRPGNSRRCCSPAPASRISAPSRSSWLLPTPGDLAPPLVKLSSSHALASGVGPEPIFLSVTEGLEIRAINFSIPMAHVLSPSNKRHRDSPSSFSLAPSSQCLSAQNLRLSIFSCLHLSIARLCWEWGWQEEPGMALEWNQTPSLEHPS